MQDVHSLLKTLSLAELNTMLKNIRLGKEHLQKCLREREFAKLLKLGQQEAAAKNTMQPDAQEHMGNIALVLNTVITSILGSWLGFASFVGLQLNSMIALIGMVILLMLVSGWIGLISFKATRRKIQTALETKKLRLVELNLLNAIYTQRNQELAGIQTDINKVLIEIIPDWQKEKIKQKIVLEAITADENQAHVYEMLVLFLQERIDLDQLCALHPAVKNKVNTVLTEIQTVAKELTQHCQRCEQNQTAETGNDKDSLINRGLTSANTYVKILTSPGIEAERTKPVPHRWLRSNIVALITGLTPTLLGSFASMFVFLSGIPDIFKAFNIDVKTLIHSQIYIQIGGISFALILSLYYCYSYIHSNYKNFSREKEIEKTEQTIAEEDEQVSHLALRINWLMQIKGLLTELAFLQTLSQFCQKSKSA